MKAISGWYLSPFFSAIKAATLLNKVDAALTMPPHADIAALQSGTLHTPKPSLHTFASSLIRAAGI